VRPKQSSCASIDFGRGLRVIDGAGSGPKVIRGRSRGTSAGSPLRTPSGSGLIRFWHLLMSALSRPTAEAGARTLCENRWDNLASSHRSRALGRGANGLRENLSGLRYNFQPPATVRTPLSRFKPEKGRSRKSPSPGIRSVIFCEIPFTLETDTKSMPSSKWILIRLFTG
jgi:hypothetical protein